MSSDVEFVIIVSILLICLCFISISSLNTPNEIKVQHRDMDIGRVKQTRNNSYHTDFLTLFVSDVNVKHSSSLKRSKT